VLRAPAAGTTQDRNLQCLRTGAVDCRTVTEVHYSGLPEEHYREKLKESVVV
jgi:hypothetical protein